MAGFRKMLALALALILCAAAAPSSIADSAIDITGTWYGTDQYGSMTLMLYDDGYYETSIVQGGQQYDQYGYYSYDALTLYLSPNGAAMAALNYWYDGHSLVLTDPQTGEAMTMARQGQGSQIPAELIGAWSGPDGDDLATLSLTADGKFTLSYENDPSVDSGDFSAADGTLTLHFASGRSAALRYLLAGGALMLADEASGETSALHRVVEARPELTPEPRPTPAADLTGAWHGRDADGPVAIELGEGGAIRFTQGGATRSGSFTADGAALKAAFDDGATATYRYLLMGDTMLLTDEGLGNPITLTKGAPPPETPDASLTGTWGGYVDGEYREMLLAAQGGASVFVPGSPDQIGTGTYATTESDLEVTLGESTQKWRYALDGDSLKLTAGDAESVFIRRPAPLTRGEDSAEPAVVTVDAALAGTWGGYLTGTYAELTFAPGGAFAQFAPGDDAAKLEGTFMAAGGTVAVLLAERTMQGDYAVAGDQLTLTWADGQPLTLTRRAGPLSRAQPSE